MNTERSFTAVVGIIFLLAAQPVFATFMPPDQMRAQILRFGTEDANMTRVEFDEIIAKADALYQPIVSSHGANLIIDANWDSDVPNARASQFFRTWGVEMFGGLARHPKMTKDGFAMVLCHELGHHLAGFPFVDGGDFFLPVWAANEGQSDYFAAHECAPRLWRDDIELNATFVDQVEPIAKDECDLVWESEDDRNLCYRINVAGFSLAATLADLQKDPIETPSYETPDENVVDKTDNDHPHPQCRLDTTFAASLCQADFQDDLIPGKKAANGTKSLNAEREAARNSCTEFSKFAVGQRPTCWYKARL